MQAQDDGGRQDGSGRPSAQPGVPVSRPSRPLAASLDLAAGAGLALLAALAFVAFPGGSFLRIALAMAVLFFVPGYLLIEAAAGPARSRAARAVRAGLAVGVSPALVGLLALATAVLPGGFRPAPIVLLLTVSSLGLAGAALWRRRAPSQHPSPDAILA